MKCVNMLYIKLNVSIVVYRITYRLYIIIIG